MIDLAGSGLKEIALPGSGIEVGPACLTAAPLAGQGEGRAWRSSFLFLTFASRSRRARIRSRTGRTRDRDGVRDRDREAERGRTVSRGLCGGSSGTRRNSPAGRRWPTCSVRSGPGRIKWRWRRILRGRLEKGVPPYTTLTALSGIGPEDVRFLPADRVRSLRATGTPRKAGRLESDLRRRAEQLEREYRVWEQALRNTAGEP